MINLFFKEKFTILLGLLFIYVIAGPFFGVLIGNAIFLDIVFSLVMVAAVLTLSREQKRRIMVILLALPCLVIIWFRLPINDSEIMLVRVALQAIFDLFMFIIIIYYIFHTPVITRDILSAAIVAYLFVALFFANSFLLLEFISPESFSISNEMIMKDPDMLKYFSLVTLSTLGYGDVLPISAQAKSMAMAEAMIGQIYLTVLVARLVGVYASEKHKPKE